MINHKRRWTPEEDKAIEVIIAENPGISIRLMMDVLLETLPGRTKKSIQVRCSRIQKFKDSTQPTLKVEDIMIHQRVNELRRMGYTKENAVGIASEEFGQKASFVYSRIQIVDSVHEIVEGQERAVLERSLVSAGDENRMLRKKLKAMEMVNDLATRRNDMFIAENKRISEELKISKASVRKIQDIFSNISIDIDNVVKEEILEIRNRFKMEQNGNLIRY